MVDRRLRAVLPLVRHRLLANGQAARAVATATSATRQATEAQAAASATAALLDCAGCCGWLLPAFASMLLLATTNHVCQDMPPVPFLWVVPLSLYLLSFIIAFDHERWYRRLPYGLAALIAIYLTAGMYNPARVGSGLVGRRASAGSGARRRAPWTPSFSYEVDLALPVHRAVRAVHAVPRRAGSAAAAAALSDELLSDDFGRRSAGRPVGQPRRTAGVQHLCGVEDRPGGRFRAGRDRGLRAGRLAAGLADRPALRLRLRLRYCGLRRRSLARLLALAGDRSAAANDDLSNAPILEQTRNFYGVLTVVEEHPANRSIPFRTCFTTAASGTECNSPIRSAAWLATTYYSEKSGVGQALEYYQQESAALGDPLRVGVVGLGVGTLAAYVYLPGIRFGSTKSIPRFARWPRPTSPIWPTPASEARRSRSCWAMPGCRWNGN